MNPAHKLKKHLGQNFLVDPRIQQRIAASCALTPADTVVEIGPGQGVITRLLMGKVKRVYSVELDIDLIGPLHAEFKDSGVEIVHADFLQWELPRLPEGVTIIGNIPYYISTPIVEKLIEQRNRIKEAYLTVQLEFGQRLAAKTGSKAYGSLSCFAQYHAGVEVLFKIKGACFRPAPKVDSCFVKLDFNRPVPYHPRDEAKLFQVIRAAFSQRRKTMANALAPLVAKAELGAILSEIGISANARAEELNLQNFVDISDRLG